MSKKEEKAKEYIPIAYKRQYNSHLDSDDIKMAFEAGWDAAVKVACEFIQENVREYHKSGIFHVADFIKDIKKIMKE